MKTSPGVNAVSELFELVKWFWGAQQMRKWSGLLPWLTRWTNDVWRHYFTSCYCGCY